MYKRMLVFVVALVFMVVGFCQPPLPDHGKKNNVGCKGGDIYEIEGPLTTATAFMLTLATGALFYKVRKNMTNIQKHNER